jgi:pyruvyltransferase
LGVKNLKNVQRIKRFFLDLNKIIKSKGKVPVVYFTNKKNVGDLINEYIIPKISGREIYKVESNWFPHLRAVGSVVGSSGFNSYIWGGGSIDGKEPIHSLDPKKIFALRGLLTEKVIEKKIGKKINVPLGDPALLMPRFYFPNVEKKSNVGIIPHFSDDRVVRELLNQVNADVELISVSQDPEQFVTQLLGCNYVISSSLHGLILADAYGIPNKWLKFSDNLLGGDFKFNDYYSVTKSSDECCFEVSSSNDLNKILNSLETDCTVKKYIKNLENLVNAFPARFK